MEGELCGVEGPVGLSHGRAEEDEWRLQADKPEGSCTSSPGLR